MFYLSLLAVSRNCYGQFAVLLVVSSAILCVCVCMCVCVCVCACVCGFSHTRYSVVSTLKNHKNISFANPRTWSLGVSCYNATRAVRSTHASRTNDAYTVLRAFVACNDIPHCLNCVQGRNYTVANLYISYNCQLLSPIRRFIQDGSRSDIQHYSCVGQPVDTISPANPRRDTSRHSYSIPSEGNQR